MANVFRNDPPGVTRGQMAAGSVAIPYTAITGADTGFTGVLDQLSVAPILAYSTRRLIGTSWGVQKRLMVLRETGADTDGTFGYNQYNVLNHAAVQSFIGANDGRLDTWYNQINGGMNARQTTDASQPLYVDNTSPDFDGTAHYLTVAHAANQLLTSGFTCAFWINPDAVGTFANILTKATNNSSGFGYRIALGATSGSLGVRVHTTAATLSDAVFTNDTWQHAIVTVDASGNVAFYRNNVACGTGGPTGALSNITTTADIRIGCSQDAASAFLNGQLDDFLLFPGVVTAADRAILYALGTPAYPPTLSVDLLAANQVATSINAIGSIGGGTQDIDLLDGNMVTATVDTSETTFTFSNPPSGRASAFTLVLTNGGSQTVNWPASVDWPSGTAPTLTASGVDVLTFITPDGGTTWYGFLSGAALA